MSLPEAISPTAAALLTPQKALSVRQPWAWLIVNGFKDVENRSRRTNLRGRIWIHASATMTRDDYSDCALSGFPGLWRMPAYDILREQCGGIVGSVLLAGCVDEYPSRWFTGPWGWLVTEARPSLFTPCKGQLNFFAPTVNHQHQRKNDRIN